MLKCRSASVLAEVRSGVGPGLHPHRDGAFDLAMPRCSVGPSSSGWLSTMSGELAFEGLGDAGVQRASRLAHKRAISGVLHERMFEQIVRMRAAIPASEQQACRDQHDQATTATCTLRHCHNRCGQ